MNQETRRTRRNAAGDGLGTVVSTSAVPYGYTVSLWSSGALLIHYRSNPTVGEIFLFAAGALAGFAVLGLRVRPLLEGVGPRTGPAEQVVTGALHWFSVGVALGGVTLVAEIPSWVAWPLGSLTAPTLFLLCSSLQLVVVAGWGLRRGQGPTGLDT